MPRSSNEWILIILGLGKSKQENRELKVIPGYTVTACLMETGGGVGVSQWLWGTQCLSLALSIVDVFTVAVEICSHNTEHQKSLLFSVPPHVGLCPSVSHKYPWSMGPFVEWPPILRSLCTPPLDSPHSSALLDPFFFSGSHSPFYSTCTLKLKLRLFTKDQYKN